MIVRILHEGQYRLPDAALWRLQQIDGRLTSSIERGDQAAFEADLAELVEYVRTDGVRLDDGHLGGSNLVLPPPDATLDEVRALLRGDRVIPG